uniref:CCHC-type domain-containing protein n=1 Tax=Acrobeloides nanus TaxID=290746 RepID=A0A914CME1_9BILA
MSRDCTERGSGSRGGGDRNCYRCGKPGYIVEDVAFQSWIRKSDNVFKFNDWPTLYAARDHMLINMRWCFYHPDSALAQLNAISNQPTIQQQPLLRYRKIRQIDNYALRIF